jgi:hypothetical protein
MMKFKKNYKNKAQNNLIYLLNVFFLRYKLKKIQNKFKNNLKFIKWIYYKLDQLKMWFHQLKLYLFYKNSDYA